MEIKWHLRVRAVVYHNEKFLAVGAKGNSHISLPGGHVEPGESIPVALEREILEEAGRKSEIKEYLGAIENAWDEDGIKQWEITHFFRVVIPDLETQPEIASAESKLHFLWVTPDDFEKYNFLPLPLRELMKNWADGDKKIWWASSMN